MDDTILRRTWAEIDLDALAHNYHQAREKIGPAVKYLGVVKADAYGHGAVQISRKLEALGADYLAVSSGSCVTPVSAHRFWCWGTLRRS